MSFSRIFGVAALMCAVAAPAVTRAQASAELDTWISETGVKQGGGFFIRASLRNTGTTVLHDVSLGIGGTDHFNFFQPLVYGVAQSGDYSCRTSELAPDHEMNCTFAVEVCCFVEGEVRDAAVWLLASTAEGWSQREQLWVKIGGTWKGWDQYLPSRSGERAGRP